MKRCIVVFGLLALMVAPYAYSANVLVNGDFEASGDVVGGTPSGWFQPVYTNAYGFAELVEAPSPVHGGVRSCSFGFGQPSWSGGADYFLKYYQEDDSAWPAVSATCTAWVYIPSAQTSVPQDARIRGGNSGGGWFGGSSYGPSITSIVGATLDLWVQLPPYVVSVAGGGDDWFTIYGWGGYALPAQPYMYWDDVQLEYDSSVDAWELY